MIRVGISVNSFSASSGGGGFDADAQAFFDRVTAAGGTLTTTEKTATNQLVLDMKSASIWTSMKAIYPMVGASAAACAQNLKSSSFTGTFTSGWTFASTGVTGNGTSAYMTTSLIPSAQFASANSGHISSYLRTSSATNQIFIGGLGTVDSRWYILNFGLVSINSGDVFGANITQGTAFLLNNRTSSTIVSQYRNNVKLIDLATTSNGLCNGQIYVGGYNNTGALLFPSNVETAFSSIGDGLTDTQASDFYTAVQAFQTTLSRQV